MAHKYDTLLVPKSESSKIRPDREPLLQPWYKERLKTKYLKRNQTLLSDALNGHRWRFLKSGLDDFRDGYPPQSQEDLAIIQSEKGAGLSPFLKNVAETFKPAQSVSKRLTKSQICFSKSLPLQQTKREQMEEIEYGLSQHPLALYPHLEEGMPPEIFEEIVGILDPEMLLMGEEICTEAPAEVKQQVTKPKMQEKVRNIKCSEDSEESKHRNPYKWILLRGTENEDQSTELKWDAKPDHKEEIKQITKEFCDWVASLGGENNNIEESTILSLLPVIMRPILPLLFLFKMELTNIPPELRMTVGTPPPLPSVKLRKTIDSEESTHPNGFKYIYGTWYLDPKTWIKRRADEPLVDPNFVPKEDESYLPEGAGAKDEEIRRLHATISFKNFIEAKGHREPEFLVKLFATVEENQMDNHKSRLEQGTK
ncbi:LOW QUALITY PROTEIN: protein FAM47E [Heterodontus francisci]|uniref:LOW QUALITY PROTEIN: protein FAM47E n=1 Tax=Heterodontus francisci TaxID=7792 RepID=UPI00355C0351